MSGSPRRARIGFVVALLLGLGVVAWAVGSPPRDGEPLDPRSSGETGARGLVLFLGELGAETRVSATTPGEGDDVLVVLEDRYSEEDRAAVRDWVAAGGTLVVADPFSELTPVVDDGGALDELGLTEAEVPRDECDVVALAGAEVISAEAALRYEVGGADSCFGDGEAAVVVVDDVGEGTVAAVGGPTFFTNDALDQDDNAVLAGSLMAPEPGTTVVVADRPPAGDGETSLSDLVAPGVKAALVQLGVAFAVYAAFRARRFGRPVPEPLPVQIAGSELVTAVGQLLQQGRDPARAGALLRDDLRRTLAGRLGLGLDADADTVAQAAAARSGVPLERLREALVPGPVTDEEALVDLARTIDAVRQEVLHVQPTP